MSRAARPLMVDTGPLYAHFDSDAARHERAASVFNGIEDGDRPFRPVYVPTYVVDELATLTLSRQDHATAAEAVQRVRNSDITDIVHPDSEDFTATCEQFARYEHTGLSFTDHMVGVLAGDRDVEHVFTFDEDHFQALGFTVVPGAGDGT